MKNVLTVGLIFTCLLHAGCSLFDSSDYEVADGDFQLINDGKVVLSLSGIEYYDFSSHILYLQPNADFEAIMEQIGGSEIRVKQKPIYSIVDHSPHSSSIPKDPFVLRDFGVFGNFGFQISFIGLDSQDPRMDPRIIRTLEQAGKYRAGIQAEITKISQLSGNKLQLTILLRNEDPENYYFLDPSKMGMPLFNYFSNGPFFFDASKQMYSYHNMPAERVEPYDRWDIAWMSVLPKNQNKMLTLEYTFDELPSGETLDIQFSFPGFHFQIHDRNELFRQEGRIWLGEATSQKNFRFR